MDTLAAFSTTLDDDVAREARTEAELCAARAVLADQLHDAVPGASRSLRRMLLAVRRDCHNGRGLARHRAAPEWPRLAEIAGRQAERVLALEERHAAEHTSFRTAFTAAAERQRDALRAPLADPAFRRGLALASPDLLAAVHASRSSGAPSARARRAEAALLRYVTRAAAKVSPFSTFTTLAVGSVRRTPGGLRLRGARWTARSLVRVKRYRLEQWTEMLCRFPAFRDGLQVVLNDSMEDAGDGRLLLVRPGRWEPDEDRGTLRYRPDALVTTAGDGIVTRVAARLAGEPLSMGALRTWLDAQGDGAEALRLLELGVLRLVLPWPVHEGHLEARMCACLRALPAAPGLDAFRAELEALVALQAEYPSAGDPARALREMHRRVDGAWRQAALLGGVDPDRVAYRGSPDFDLYEDVLRVPDGPAAAAFYLDSDVARGALRAGRLLVRLSTLFDSAHDWRATVSDLAAAQWPGRGEVGVLELFRAAHLLWRDYQAFRAAGWGEADACRTWNPRGLPELERLRAWRADVHAGLEGCTARDGDVVRVDEAALRTLLDAVPPRYTDAAGRGACLLLQPASTDGSLWRLNRLMEGTGRCGSRYTPLMGARARRRYTAHLRRRGRTTVDGESAALLDLQCVHGDTLNVHAPQTPTVLSLPGDRVDAGPGHRLSLGNLKVCFRGADRLPVLRGPDGARLLPAHLGLAFEAYLPPLVRFLAALGPGALRPVLPPRMGWMEGERVVSPRILLGNLVLHRRGWSVPVAPLAQALSHADDAASFAAVTRLRMDWGIPARVFVAEPRGARGTPFKPQYLDLGSPLFLPLLRDLAAGGQARVTLEEMLPDPAMCPRDPEGRGWAVEVALDSVAVAPARRMAGTTRQAPAALRSHDEPIRRSAWPPDRG
ncbi:lantibiotic dehydratase [Longimicrobium sp.]|uniref:lantibiotic dehydratase n=1 Tax=Longimicrobium sp. TaxID=2029185 RepID=UPI002E368913|nr:lantibiotic dehydratase [Longimicrobium sp.]HEX6038742.1 lantibiotic dehydratase [Longimicrobium sp.]